MANGLLRGVFINCPFDHDYHSCHLALILTVVACGLEPRSALETGTASLPRMERITRALCESTYSIHDLTRAYGDPDVDNLARFNMPFELGMAFLFAKKMAPLLDVEHEWFVLLPNAHPYGEFISDLAGYDLAAYDGTSEGLIPHVLGWLATRPSLPPIPPNVTPSELAALMPTFERIVEAQIRLWGGHLPWTRLVKLARDLVASRL